MDAIGLAVDGEGLRCIERRGARSSDDKKAEPPGPSGVPGVLLALGVLVSRPVHRHRPQLRASRGFFSR